MDVPPLGTPNGHTVVLLHGNNFAGFYWGGPIDVLRKEGFRVVVPDQIGYGRSSKPIIPYNFDDMARNTMLVLRSLGIQKAMIVGHSMGGMLAVRFARNYPERTVKLVLEDPIGLEGVEGIAVDDGCLPADTDPFDGQGVGVHDFRVGSYSFGSSRNSLCRRRASSVP